MIQDGFFSGGPQLWYSIHDEYILLRAAGVHLVRARELEYKSLQVSS